MPPPTLPSADLPCGLLSSATARTGFIRPSQLNEVKINI